MTEKEKCRAGQLYDANYDAAILADRAHAKDLCFAFNQTLPSNTEEQERLLRQLIGKLGPKAVVTAPFYCDYGYNITIGADFYTNHNCIILDGAPVVIGDNVFIGPNCCLSTAGHPLDAAQRNRGLEFAHPITIGNSVWIGANVSVLPGVTIGDGAVIGAGSVVTKSIPAGAVAVGVPCRVQRYLTHDNE